MYEPKRLAWWGSFLLAMGVSVWHVRAAEMPLEEAWKALPKYQYGDDLGALLAIDRAVIEAMATAESRSACASRLAGILVETGTTPAAQQYICLQLRQIGTAAEVPALTDLLANSETTEIARMALQAIPGEEAAAALRNALTTLQGPALVGVIHSVAARNDKEAVDLLVILADSSDSTVANAALWALGEVDDQRAVAFLLARAEQAGMPAPREVAVPLLRCAARHAAAGQDAPARAIYEQLSQEDQQAGVRRAALEGLLNLLDTQAKQDTVLDWLRDSGGDRARLAAGHLQELTDPQIDQLLTELPQLPEDNQLAVIDLAAARRGQLALPMVLSMVASDNLAQKLGSVRCLGAIGDASALPTLLDLLADDQAVSAAQDALVQLPRDGTIAALLTALHQRPEIRVPVIEVLVRLKCYEAIDPLIEIASHTDAAVYDPALAGLRGIADPDQTDIPRLVQLLLKTELGRHRDEVEKTLVLVTDKLPADADRSLLVREALADVPDSLAPKYLPLLGRLGGEASLARIQAALESEDQQVRDAAVRALCNWPSIDVAEQLERLAKESPERNHRRWALRAYVRVVTLGNDQAEGSTLGRLQQAMKLAETVDDRRLIISRTATVRSIDSVRWIAPYLDDADLREAACAAIVELAHHRFLREPNKSVFDPLLEKIARVSQVPAVVERAERYRLGL